MGLASLLIQPVVIQVLKVDVFEYTNLIDFCFSSNLLILHTLVWDCDLWFNLFGMIAFLIIISAMLYYISVKLVILFIRILCIFYKYSNFQTYAVNQVNITSEYTLHSLHYLSYLSFCVSHHSKITLIIRCATDAIKKSHYYEFVKLTTSYGITLCS